MRQRTTPDIAGLAIAAALFVIAGLILWDSSRLTITATYGIGPEVMPVVIAIGLALLAVANLALAWRGRTPRRPSADPGAILLILGGLAALIVSIGLGGGFIPGTAILFACTAAAFGRRGFLMDLAIGLGLAFLIYLLFVKLLTLSLPSGPIEALF
jgi:putative tricarboxylic transport membrane protein